MTGDASVALRDVSKWYGPVIGVNRVDLDLGNGVTGLLGPNGAGKSTLMKLITGQLRPSLGTVEVLGRPVWRCADVRRRLGFSPDGDAFHEEMTGRRFVYSMARLSGLGRRAARLATEDVLEEIGMRAMANRRLRACSKGMRQRIKLGQALVHDPDILVLDEPLTGIDPTGRADLLDLFRRLGNSGKTVLVSSHILEEVEAVTDRVVLVAWGRVLAAGPVTEIRALLKEHPLSVRIGCDRPRDLAGELLRSNHDVVGVRLPETLSPSRSGSAGEVVVEVRHPDAFFRELPGVVVDLDLEVDSIEPLDESAAAIFDYLLGEPTPGGRS